jgi:hypothetical protein
MNNNAASTKAIDVRHSIALYTPMPMAKPFMKPSMAANVQMPSMATPKGIRALLDGCDFTGHDRSG